MKVIRITRKNRGRYQAQIAALEQLASYPLGSDAFKIDHGEDYFAFFDRLGEASYYAAVIGEKLIAVGAGILRKTPQRGWYVCDLKVHPDYRGKHIPLRMMYRTFLQNYVQCPRGYGISMNPADGTPNRVARLFKHFKWASIQSGPQLLIYSMTYSQMKSAEPILQRHRGEISYLSLHGKKDLILASTQLPMPLLHVQYGKIEHGALTEPSPKNIHMFCAPEGDLLVHELAREGFEPTATATVVHHRMKEADWRLILTSDI